MKKSTKRGLITSLVIAIGTGAAALAGFIQDMTDSDIDKVEETKNESNDKAEEENPEDKGDDSSNTGEEVEK